MTGRDWHKTRNRQLVRDRGVDDVHGRELREGDIERAVLGDTSGLPGRRSRGRDPRPKKDPIGKAAMWLIRNRPRLHAEGKHPFGELKREFHLASKEAVEAIRRANAIEQKER